MLTQVLTAYMATNSAQKSDNARWMAFVSVVGIGLLVFFSVTLTPLGGIIRKKTYTFISSLVEEEVVIKKKLNKRL